MTTFDEWWETSDGIFYTFSGKDKARIIWNAALSNVTVELLFPTKNDLDDHLKAEYWKQRELGLRGADIKVESFSQVYDFIRTHIETQLNKLKEGKEKC